jgi:ERF superfamily
MKTSERTADLIVALLKAKENFQAIVKTEHVTVTTKSGRKYDFDYAPLEVIQAATETSLSAEGLALISAVQPGANGTVEVMTRLLHTSEQWLESCIPSGPLEDVKALGGFVSYARRYNTLALLDLSAEDDLDGSQATGDHIEPRRKVSPPAAPSNGQPPAPKAEARMTDEAIDALVYLAVEQCQEDREVFATRCRRAMKLKADAPITKRFLGESMSPEAYRVVHEWYLTLYSQLQRKTEVSHATDPTPTVTPEPAPAPTEETERPFAGTSAAGASNAAPPSIGEQGSVRKSSTVTDAAPESPAEESPAAVPTQPGSPDSGRPASDPDTKREYHKLYQEALGWGVEEREIKHVLDHHRDLGKCRTILWRARRQPEPALAS